MTLIAYWVTLRARWMTLIAYWVTLRAKSLLGDAESSLGDANISMAGVHQLREVLHQQTLDAAEEASTAGASYSDRLRDEEFAHKENVAVLQRQVCVWGEERERERVDLLGSHGRWKRPCIQTTPRCDERTVAYHTVLRYTAVGLAGRAET